VASSFHEVVAPVIIFSDTVKDIKEKLKYFKESST
jgi:hypothetical protein